MAGCFEYTSPAISQPERVKVLSGRREYAAVPQTHGDEPSALPCIPQADSPKDRTRGITCPSTQPPTQTPTVWPVKLPQAQRQRRELTQHRDLGHVRRCKYDAHAHRRRERRFEMYSRRTQSDVGVRTPGRTLTSAFKSV